MATPNPASKAGAHRATDRSESVEPARRGVSPRGLLGLRGASGAQVRGWLTAARAMAPHATHPGEPLAVLRGRTVAMLFCEHSTRTRGSFTIAAQRLGGSVVDFSEANSTAKGETLADTVRTIEAMGVDAIVLRSAESGAAHAAQRIAGVPIINAGDGRHEHPTQGLLDTLALCDALGGAGSPEAGALDLSGRRVVIVGDVVRSRVARSSALAMRALGVSIAFVGPEAMVPCALTSLVDGASVERDLDAAMQDADAVMMLRAQFERGAALSEGYRAAYGMTRERASRLGPGTLVMHPGPMNPGIEIDGDVAGGAGLPQGVRSLVLDQVRAGVAVRMAVLAEAITGAG